MSLNKSIIVYAALTWFWELGYAIVHGPHMAPGEPQLKDDMSINATKGMADG